MGSRRNTGKRTNKSKKNVTKLIIAILAILIIVIGVLLTLKILKLLLTNEWKCDILITLQMHLFSAKRKYISKWRRRSPMKYMIMLLI